MTTTMLTTATHDFTRALAHACDGASVDRVAAVVPESGALGIAAALLSADAAALTDERCVDVGERAASMLSLIDDAAGLALQVARRQGCESVARDVDRRRRVLLHALRALAS